MNDISVNIYTDINILNKHFTSFRSCTNLKYYYNNMNNVQLLSKLNNTVKDVNIRKPKRISYVIVS